MSDPTPTVMDWKIDHYTDAAGVAVWGAVGIERPANRERAVGRWLIEEDGTRRDLRYVFVPLPSDPDKAEVMTKLKAAV